MLSIKAVEAAVPLRYEEFAAIEWRWGCSCDDEPRMRQSPEREPVFQWRDKFFPDAVSNSSPFLHAK